MDYNVRLILHRFSWIHQKQWQAEETCKESATLPSNGSVETAAVYRLCRIKIPKSQLPQQVVQLEIHTWPPLMARSTCCCCCNKAVSTSDNSLAGMLRFTRLELSSRFLCFHTLLRPPVLHQKPVTCGSIWPRPCKMQELGDAWRSFLRTAFGAAIWPQAHRIPWKRQMAKLLRWGLGLLWSLMTRCTLSSWWRTKSWGRFQGSLSYQQLGIHKDKAKLLQDSSNVGSLPGKEQNGGLTYLFLTTQSWTDLGGSESTAATCRKWKKDLQTSWPIATKKRSRVALSVASCDNLLVIRENVKRWWCKGDACYCCTDRKVGFDYKTLCRFGHSVDWVAAPQNNDVPFRLKENDIATWKIHASFLVSNKNTKTRMFLFTVEGYGRRFVHRNWPLGIVWELKLHIPSPARSAGRVGWGSQLPEGYDVYFREWWKKFPIKPQRWVWTDYFVDVFLWV